MSVVEAGSGTCGRWSFQLEETAGVKWFLPSVCLPVLRIAPIFDDAVSFVAVTSRPPATFCHAHVLFLSFFIYLFIYFFFTAPKDKVKRVESVETEAGQIRLLDQGRA